MPMSMKFLGAVALFVIPSVALLVGTQRQAAPGPAPAPALSQGAPSPEQVSPNAFEISFELEKVNFDDLEKQVPNPPSARETLPVRKAAEAESGKGFGGNTWDGLTEAGASVVDGHRAVSKAMADTAEAYTHHVNERLQDGSEVVSEATSSSAGGLHDAFEATGDLVHEGISGGFQGAHEAVHGLLQNSQLLSISDQTKTQLLVANVMENAIRKAIQDTIDGNSVSGPGPVPAPATAPAPRSLVHTGAPAAAPSFVAPSPALHNMNIFVEFHPGQEKPVSNRSVISSKALPPIDHRHPGDGKEILRHSNPHKPNDMVGRTTKVDVVIMGEGELPYVKNVVSKAASDGRLGDALGDSLGDVIGFKPKVTSFVSGYTKIKQWSVNSCAAHMAQVIAKFSVAYTRRMVPSAIFNECTNYATTMSFSTDRFPTMLDVARCRAASTNFAKHWNYGQGASVEPAGLAPTNMAGLQQGHQGRVDGPTDMTGFCVDICEQKFGSKAPQCQATAM